MVDEIFKKNIFQLARILIFLGKSHFPSVIGWEREIHLKHIKNRIKVNKILPLEWQSGVLNYKILSLLLTSQKPLPNLKYIFHLCHKFCHAFDHNSFSQDKMLQKWGTKSITFLVLLALNFSKYLFGIAYLCSFRRCSGFQSTQLLVIPGFPGCGSWSCELCALVLRGAQFSAQFALQGGICPCSGGPTVAEVVG